MPKFKFEIPRPTDATLDLNLLHKFKTAILEDNFNLTPVFLNYYQELNTVQNIEELNQKRQNVFDFFINLHDE